MKGLPFRLPAALRPRGKGRRCLSALVAGLAAGSIATLAQLLLWWAFTDALPGILYRDTRMAAAILLGPASLHSAEVSIAQWLLAGALHFALSVAYAFIIQALAPRTLPGALLAGALCGAALFFINMYFFTYLFPWFEASRDVITFAAHLVFGAAAAVDWLAGTASASTRARQARAGAQG